ncbi:dnaJ homolog subfamily B member 9-like [Montipora capricornis]|uniref:dnaJ homolog subfamily B member 9-like n=1 Tax=Montipora foliosa TaxID=591990 RepID=UPI0035F1659B
MNCDNLVLLVTAAFSVFANIDLALAKDYYKILGVSRDANDRQIKKAFRKLAMKYHPDKNKQKDAEAKFREIAEAYEVLSDEKKRHQYDQFGSEGMNDNGFNFHQQGFQSFDDIFKDFDFGAGHGNRKEWKFSFGDGGFDDFFDDDIDDDDDDDLFGGFKFGGFGDSFFDHDHDSNFRKSRQREDVYDNGHGHRFHRNVRHAEFQQSSRGRTCRTVTRKVGNMVTTFTDCS